MARPLNCPEDLYALMRLCWRVNIDSRPTFKSLYKRLGDMYDSTQPTQADYQTDLLQRTYSVRSDLSSVSHATTNATQQDGPRSPRPRGLSNASMLFTVVA